jgi:hypothetical protein
MILLDFIAVKEFIVSFSSVKYPWLHSFNWNNSYENMIMYFILISFLGQLMFLISFFKIRSLNKKVFRLLGTILMLFGFFLITKDVFKNGLAVFTFVTGIPFLYFVFLELRPFFKYNTNH